ncbi:hypothetical protein ACOKFD_13600 [Flagellimonas sp. S174]|uniref:hypothetical protein n=1 Tax=Flagellimonas sp. S174 TaxID=3410790 RepID=UPI00260A146B|nr:hypothetical protein [uncultured Allomuricauda sp.]
MAFKKISTDRLLGISAMVISILTLVIFIYQTDIMRVQSKLSVKPRLDFTTNQGGNDSLVTFQEVLENKGLGPAIIDSIYYIYQGSHFALDTETFFQQEFPKLLEYGYLSQHSTLGRGTTLTPNEERSLFVYKLPTSKMDSVFEYLSIETIEDVPFLMEVKYTSIYEDELWKVNSNQSVPKKLD